MFVNFWYKLTWLSCRRVTKQLQEEGIVVDEESEDMREEAQDNMSDSSDENLEDLVSEISDIQIQVITWGDDD